jgi:hypothetical protein
MLAVMISRDESWFADELRLRSRKDVTNGYRVWGDDGDRPGDESELSQRLMLPVLQSFVKFWIETIADDGFYELCDAFAAAVLS